MRRTLLLMVVSALLLTQCRKPSIEFPTAEQAVTVSMTITAGPGSKTDISTTGGVTWSSGDVIYVGYDGKNVGSLTLTEGAGSPTGTFTGTVTLTGVTDGDPCEFKFFYLGTEPTMVDATTATVSFAVQDIYAEGGKLKNASKFHVGYGTATGTVSDGVISGINVTMKSKVAIAYFSFKKNSADYTEALTLSGDNIYNSMKVNFGGTFTGEKTDGGNISLGAGHAERYVMLVPTSSTTGSQTLNFFTGDFTGSTKLENGIEANKFYRMPDGSAIEVTVKPIEFTVDANDTKVKFSPGNLYWDGTESKFKFESNQWDFRNYNGMTGDAAVIGGESTITPAGTVGSFFWSKTASVAYAGSYSDSGASASDVFFTNSSSFQVDGETAGTWRTLSKAEWDYLLGYDPEQYAQTDEYGRPGAKGLCACVTLTDVGVYGLVILPDGSTVTPSSVTTAALVASSGAVFLPAAGRRWASNLLEVGSSGYYCASTPDKYFSAHYMGFVKSVNTNGSMRSLGCSARLVRKSS